MLRAANLVFAAPRGVEIMRIQTIALRCWIALGAAASGAFGCSHESAANVEEAVGTTQSALRQTGEIRIGPSATVPRAATRSDLCAV
jgi:hypothetical protein